MKLIKTGMVAAALILICSAVGCNKKPDAAVSSAPDYPVTLSVFTVANLQEPPADNRMYAWIRDTFNVTFDWDISVGDKDQKIGVLIASGDYPDILHIESSKFIEAGAVIPLEDLIEQYAPRIKKHYESVWDKLKEDDGHIYCLPNWGVIDGRDQSTWYGDSAMWIQKEVLREFGYPQIKTMDEYFDILIRYKEKYPKINGMDTIPFTILTYAWRSFCMVNPPSFLAGFPNDGGLVERDTRTFHANIANKYAKRWFKKLNELNAQGHIDRSCFVDNYDQYIAKLSSGRVLGIHDQYWQFQSATTALQNQGMYNRSMAPLPVVFDETVRPWYRNKTLPNLQRGFGISIKAKDPVRIIRFMDAQMSDEAQKVLHWGFENQDYFLDKDGVPYRTQDQRDAQADPSWEIRNRADLWYQTAPKLQGSFADGLATDINEIPGEFLATQKPEDRELWNAYGVANYAELMDKDPPENPVWFPLWQISPPDGSEAQICWTKCEELYRKHLPQIILAPPAEFESLWAKYEQALDSAGIKKYEAFMQDQLEARIRKWSR